MTQPVIEWSGACSYWYKEGKQKNGLSSEIYVAPSYKIIDGVRIPVKFPDLATWYIDGKLHRDGNLTEIICSDGEQYRYKEDKLHREDDLPALIFRDGEKQWYKEGKLHRDGDLPARTWPDGRKEWYKFGEKYHPILS